MAAEIRRAIAKGKAKPGERLPPAGDFVAMRLARRHGYPVDELVDIIQNVA